ncbi:alcohol dehydrogenase [Streptomyces sp. NPDC050504]|uniref:alcohol dehydrogenase n=1 Tax=Streptomyces sp. NPDC050504 TaxID=3365618 RepID=UPI00379741FC
MGTGPSFRSLGVDMRVFLDTLPQQALNTYEGQCVPVNPRVPMVDDMQQLMRVAHYGQAAVSRG